MEKAVEIGPPEIRQAVLEDLEIFDHLEKGTGLPAGICSVIVPADFKATVNRLEGRTDFAEVEQLADRESRTMGKIVRQGEKYIILISPLIYHAKSPSIRVHLYTHEFFHVINHRLFPQIEVEDLKGVEGAIHFYGYDMFGEYRADRKGLTTASMGAESDSEWSDFVRTQARFYASYVTDPKHLDIFNDFCAAYDEHGDYLRAWRPLTESYCNWFSGIIHYFAFVHQFPELKSELNLQDPENLNADAYALTDYFRRKYEEKSVDLSDGKNVIYNFLRNYKPFGSFNPPSA